MKLSMFKQFRFPGHFETGEECIFPRRAGVWEREKKGQSSNSLVAACSISRGEHPPPPPQRLQSQHGSIPRWNCSLVASYLIWLLASYHCIQTWWIAAGLSGRVATVDKKVGACAFAMRAFSFLLLSFPRGGCSLFLEWFRFRWPFSLAVCS